MSADENSVDCAPIRAEILDVSIPRIRPSHYLPVWNNHCGLFDDGTCPCEFPSSSKVDATGQEFDPSRFNLFNRHPPIFRLISILIDELDQVYKIRIEKCDPVAAWINDLLST